MSDKELRTEYRLEGLEPDNLLAFLALLGLLRALDDAHPEWRTKVRWSLDEPPLRPVLILLQPLAREEIGRTVASAVANLARFHNFNGQTKLDQSVLNAREMLSRARETGTYSSDLVAALLCDAAVKVEKGKKLDQIEATPLCLQSGQGHQCFLERLAAVPNLAAAPRGRGKKALAAAPDETICEALFHTWARQDSTPSFRWDPAEDVRYALMFGNPSYAGNKNGAQHGANRLAAIGLSMLTAAPAERSGHVRLSLPGGVWNRGFSMSWPIWRASLSAMGVRALLTRGDLTDASVQRRLGIERVLTAQRISVGKFMNFTTAKPSLPSNEVV